MDAGVAQDSSLSGAYALVLVPVLVLDVEML